MKKLHLYAVAGYSEDGGKWFVMSRTATTERCEALQDMRNFKEIQKTVGVKQRLRVVKLKEVRER